MKIAQKNTAFNLVFSVYPATDGVAVLDEGFKAPNELFKILKPRRLYWLKINNV